MSIEHGGPSEKDLGLSNIENASEELSGDEFRVNQIVKVQRSSGAIENNWHIAGLNGELAVLHSQDTTGKILEKVVTTKQLAKWQAELPDQARNVDKYSAAAIARDMGIDTAQPDWEDKYNEELRRRTGT